MIPQILSIGPIPINSFGLLVACALIAGSFRLALSFETAGLPPEKAERYVFVGGIVGLVGARLWHILENFGSLKHNLLGALFSSAGFTFYGGFILSFAALWILSRIDKISFVSFVDVAGPTMTLGYAIGRLGCQLSGDGDYGRVTESWLGMSYATGVFPTAPGVLAYPTPLYESFLCFLILPILLRVEKSPRWQKVPLSRCALYLVLIASERFLVETLRINPKITFGLSEAQIISVLLIIVGGGLLLVLKRKFPHDLTTESC